MPVELLTAIPQPQADGVYPYQIVSQPGLPPALQTNLVGRTGFADWGPIDSAVFYNTLSQAVYLWGANANIILSKSADPNNGNNGSLVAATQAAGPEGASFSDVRVTDGSDAAATGSLVDASAGIVANLAAFYHGNDGNSITATVSVYQGQLTSGGSVVPMCQLTVVIGNRPQWKSVPFVAGTTGAGYVKATFLANLQAALLGTYGNGGTACPYVVYVSSGSSVLAPVLTANVFSGGLSGYNTWGGGATPSSCLIGAPATGDNTGIYAFQGVNINLLHCVGLTDLTQASTLATYAQENTCIALISDKLGTTSATAISDRAADNASSPWLIFCNDFEYTNDVVDGLGPVYIDPAVKTAAIISSLSAYVDPSNEPIVGAQNLVGTYRTVSGIPYSNAELGQLQQAGILVLSRPANRGANLFCLAHGMTSDGVTPIADTRMLNLIANQLTLVLGGFVSDSQTPPPPAGTPDTDVTRSAARAAITAYLAELANISNPQIAAYNVIIDGSNNSQATVAAGYLYTQVQVTTLAGIRFILLGLEIGSTVQIQQAS